jgi:hypothetical protein
MNSIIITDIFGNKISSSKETNGKLPFIILHSIQPYLILEKISKGSETEGIWKPNAQTIFHILYSNSINPINFSPVGDIWYTDSKLPKEFQLLLVNTDTNISRFPIDFVKIDNYSELSIWRPISPRGYQEMGLIASQEKPSLRSLKVINDKLLAPFNNEVAVSGRNTHMNEFYLLSNIELKKYTIDRTKLLQSSSNIKISSNDSYITNDNGSLYLKPNNNSKSQKITYSINGELQMDDKCISAIDDNIGIQPCDNNLPQKWYTYQDKYISMSDGKCLTNKDGKIKKENCSKNNNQKWFTDDYDTVLEDSQESVGSWETAKGKKVVLIQPDNPWYINKKKSMPEGLIRQGRTELNKEWYRDNANFNSKFMMDVTRPNMGYGYSYADRQGQQVYCLDDCNKIDPNDKRFEYFDNDGKKIDFNVIACSLLLLIFLLVVVRYYMNRA